ncbi:hypothetical protein H4W34_007344 [Actinomadura algeriensis]|uniref:FR47-like protein n=1 Tax=Actinomadura algeriensis TaxID=1679523 RepID=A0ABR9K4L3_9ACTN|nr:hypothetical protein [Actinomadura algeriensis]
MEALAEGARTLVIVAEPRAEAIGIYRSLGFADAERQVRLQRPADASVANAPGRDARTS